LGLIRRQAHILGGNLLIPPHAAWGISKLDKCLMENVPAHMRMEKISKSALRIFFDGEVIST
jgi:hypothetical protein